MGDIQAVLALSCMHCRNQKIITSATTLHKEAIEKYLDLSDYEYFKHPSQPPHRALSIMYSPIDDPADTNPQHSNQQVVLHVIALVKERITTRYAITTSPLSGVPPMNGHPSAVV
jgi:hypothetical protein